MNVFHSRINEKNQNEFTFPINLLINQLINEFSFIQN